MEDSEGEEVIGMTNIEKLALRLKRLGDPALSLSLLDAFLDGSAQETDRVIEDFSLLGGDIAISTQQTMLCEHSA